MARKQRTDNVVPLLQPTLTDNRLFSLRPTDASPGTNAGIYFADKQRAKALRDQFNADPNDNRTWIVCRGPDHRLGAS